MFPAGVAARAVLLFPCRAGGRRRDSRGDFYQTKCRLVTLLLNSGRRLKPFVVVVMLQVFVETEKATCLVSLPASQASSVTYQ